MAEDERIDWMSIVKNRPRDWYVSESEGLSWWGRHVFGCWARMIRIWAWWAVVMARVLNAVRVLAYFMGRMLVSWRIGPDLADFIGLVLVALGICGFTFLWGVCYFGIILHVKDEPYGPVLVVLLLPTYWLGLVCLPLLAFLFRRRGR